MNILVAVIAMTALLEVVELATQRQTAEPNETPAAVINDGSLSLEQKRERLLNYGDSAVEPVTQTLKNDKNLTPIKAAFLIGVLTSLNTPRSRDSVMSSLFDDRPVVRSYAAAAVGKMGMRCAVPSLIRLLDDTSVYGAVTSTDPHRESRLTVADTSLEALTKITGLRSPNRSEQPYERWWQRNHERLNCEGAKAQ